ncbi:MAG: VWA domain-containing protein [Anaerolineae bacterium]|jgi:Ca-activated chloride channel family protein|nr:VWA domain-containing protein [Anaerolineae bacterium]
MMTFDAPWALGLLAVVALIAGWAAYTFRRRLARLALLGEADRIAALSTLDVRRRWQRLWLWTSSAACVVIALAQPVWGIDAELVQARGAAVVFVLDISASMDAEDVLPSRLERAKLTILDVLAAVDGSLVGFVPFAGDAFVQLPLTGDVDTARAFVQVANSASVTRQGTAIGQALGLARTVVDERVAGEALVVLMTDGEDHQGDPLGAVEGWADDGISLHVIGYGTPEGDVIPVRDADGVVTGVKADAAGSIVISQLDEPLLMALAEAGGGVYQRADTTGVEAVAVIEAVRDLELGALGARLRTVSVPRFGIFLALAVGLLAAEMIMSERRRDNASRSQ